jgi:hypothetical protein
MGSTILIVYDGTMVYHRGESGMLGIATGNFASSKYLNEKGEEMRRPAAGLWLVVRGRPDTNAFQRVHAGQQIDHHNFQIKVLAVGSDRHSMFVRVEVTEPSGGANASGKNN